MGRQNSASLRGCFPQEYACGVCMFIALRFAYYATQFTQAKMSTASTICARAIHDLVACGVAKFVALHCLSVGRDRLKHLIASNRSGLCAQARAVASSLPPAMRTAR